VRLADTVCSATKHRQHAATELAQRCDVVIVVGSTRSNNTLELVATCRSQCARVFQVQAPDDLREEWLRGARVAGLTAGASTPDAIIDLVEARLRNLAGGQLAA
jgi:small subunit ribosomal protein S1